MRGELRDILIRRANGEEFDMREWLAVRRLQMVESAEHAFANSISQTAMQLSFVKRARVDLQTSLGGRKGAGGVDVAGALRETDDGIVGWQLRAYAAEHSAKGLNAGLFYRRVVNNALAGVNVFADYEDGDDGDFWRWSIGGDVKTRLGELSANRYFTITDAQVVGGQNTYTREGYDVDFALRIPRLEWAKARVGYYEFKGEFGDEDENGFRAGLDLSPGAGLVVGVEYDDDDGKFGGNISYTHHFGETQQGAQRAGEFNPRAHFYDSVRREYSQRISRASGGNNNAVIVNSGVSVGVFGDVVFGTATATVIAPSVNINFAFPLTGTMVMVSTHTAPNTGTLAMRHGGGWSLDLAANSEVAFLQGTTLSVTRGSGTFERGGSNLRTVLMGSDTIGLLGTRFDFRVDGGNAYITLHDGALSMSVGGNVSVTVVDAPGPGTRVYLYDSDGNSVGVVGCGAGEVRSTAGLSADCKPDIGVNFVGDSNSAPVTTTGDITIGTLQVTGGFDAQDINIVGAHGDFRLANVDGMPSLRALVLGGNNNSARAATVVLRGDDNENRTDAAMLTVTVMVVERVVLLGGGRVTVFAAADENEVVAVFQPVGGFPPYDNLNKLLPSGALPSGFQESAAAASVTITRTNTNAAAGSEHIIAYEVTETRDGGDAASATVMVTVIASLNAAIDFAGGALTAGMSATVATISAAGGIGDYTFSANNNNISFVDGTIAVANFNNAGTISVNLIANDDAAITEPFTVVITLTALNTATAAPDNATFREFQTGASVTLANLTYSGATGGGNVTATVITVQNGAGEVGGRELLVSSDMRGTSEVQVAVYDTANAAAPKSTLTLSLEFVAPLTAVFADSPNFAPLTNTAAHITIATVTISGGDGEYGNPVLQVNMQDFAFTDNTILILNNTESRNESGRTVTALIVADDNSNISEQASLSVSVVVADELRIDGGMFTILADTSSLPLITISAIGGERPHSYSAPETPSGTHPAIAAAGTGPYTISKTGTQQTANADLRWIYQAMDNRGSVAAATVDVSVVTTISLSASNLIAEAQRGAITTNILQTLGTLGAVGGLGSYVFTSSDARASLVDMSVMVLNFTAAAETTVHYTIDDRNADNTPAPLTPPVTFFVTVNAIAPLALEPIVLTLTAGDTVPAQGADSGYRIRASGGTPPYTYGYERGFRNHPFELAGNGSSSGRLNWSGQVLQSNPGIYNADSMQVRDSSTPSRAVTLRITAHIVSPPSGG